MLTNTSTPHVSARPETSRTHTRLAHDSNPWPMHQELTNSFLIIPLNFNIISHVHEPVNKVEILHWFARRGPERDSYLVSTFQQEPHKGACNAQLPLQTGIGHAELPVVPGRPVPGPHPRPGLGLLQGQLTRLRSNVTP